MKYHVEEICCPMLGSPMTSSFYQVGGLYFCIKFPSSSKLSPFCVIGAFWCSSLWQSWHRLSKFSQLSVMFGLSILAGVIYVLWWHILAVPHIVHIYNFVTAYNLF